MLSDLLRRTVKTVAQGDPYYSAISLLLPMDGTNGSTTFTDKSLNNLTVTANGSAQISTAQSKFGGASAYFDGSTGYASVLYSSMFAFPGDFTVEFWINFSSHASYGGMVCNATAVTSWVGWNIIFNSTSNNIRVEINNGGATIVSSTAMTPSVWSHVALTRKGSAITLFLNGTSVGSATYSSSIDSGSAQLVVGTERQRSSFSNCYIDDLAIYKGVAIYPASGFTPPTKAHATFEATVPADAYFSYNSLLLHMDGTNGSTSFVDSGPNALAVTASNATITTSNAKAGFGQSGYFNGANSILSCTANSFSFGSSDFTVEFFVRFDVLDGSFKHVCGNVSNSGTMGFGVYANKLYATTLTVGYQASTVLSINTWYHAAFVRRAGTLYIYLNGTLDTSVYVATSLTNSSFTVGGVSGSSFYLAGQIDDLRVSNGVARYTSNFTPPTKALPNLYNPYTTLPVSGAALWLDASQQSSLFTDAGVNTVKASGDLVYQWNDLSGNNRHAVQVSSGNRPTWTPPASGQNGLGAVAFNGTSGFLSTSSNIGISGIAGRTVFTVQKDYNPGTSVYPAVFYWGTGSLRAYYAHVYNNGIAQIDIYGYGATTAISAGTFSVLTSNLNGSNQPQIRRNSGSWSVISAAANTTDSSLYVGKSVVSSGQYFSGPICEVIVYNQNLSDAQCLTVENYLRAKWGF